MSIPILFVGQALPRRKQKILFETSALYKWFSSHGISQDLLLKNCVITAILMYYPGKNKFGTGDRLPTTLEVTENLPRLLTLIDKTNPKILVPVGVFSIRAMMTNQSMNLDKIIGRKFIQSPYGIGKQRTIIPLPHPSGLSRWTWQNNNRVLLDQALSKIIMDTGLKN